MSYNKDFVVNEEQISSFLVDAVNGVENATEAELQSLNEIKKIFKKNVGMFRRDYVASWLIKNAVFHKRSFDNSRYEKSTRYDRHTNVEHTTNQEKSRYDRTNFPKTEHSKEERPRAPRAQIDSSVSSTIFVGIGRNRRVFPRDLVGLLASVAGLERERIGDIRVLANYSFVQLYSEDCEKVINALNGYDYRGRKLSVSYSKQKIEDADSANYHTEDEKAEEAGAGKETSSTESTPKESVSMETVPSEQKQTSTASSFTEDKPYSETTDDGQVKSHFGNGAAY